MQLWCLFSDMDRTVIPNGAQPESAFARPLLGKWSARDDTRIVYVSGRNIHEVRQGISQYGLPVPDYIIADVGTSIYQCSHGEWRQLHQWRAQWEHVWNHAWLYAQSSQYAHKTGWQIQEKQKQGPYKISFYVPVERDSDAMLAPLAAILSSKHDAFQLIYSIDDTKNLGLLDVVPKGADKLHAIKFLIDYMQVENSHCYFAGDSGNDISVLSSDIQGILVANASEDIRRQAIQTSSLQGLQAKLYCAKGHWLGLNGNYAAGVLEGISHFSPHWQPVIVQWLQEMEQDHGSNEKGK